jgi:hypothetical protein
MPPTDKGLNPWGRASQNGESVGAQASASISRGWKERFPAHWQEVVRFDGTGEKHVADIRTEHGLVLEFQHSHLAAAEIAAREDFHGNLV